MKRKRQVMREQNLARLRELWSARPACLPEVVVVELQHYHLRLTCEGRQWDYWPSTGRAWEVGASDSTLMSADEVFSAVTGTSPEFVLTPTIDAGERRVLAWLKRHERRAH